MYSEDGRCTELPKKAAFWVDFTLPAVRYEMQTDYTELDYLDNEFKKNDSYPYIGIIRPEKGLFLRYTDPLAGEGSKRRLAILPSGNEFFKQYYDFTFDPRFYFRYGSGKHVENFRLLATSGDPLEDYSCETQGNLVTIRSSLNTYRFDMSKGCNLVYHNTDYGDYLQSEQIMDYIEKDGVFVPSLADLRIADGADLWHRYIHRKVVFRNQEVNVPIEESVFKMDSLVLKHGDEVNDTLLNYVCTVE